ncbi:MAG: hypothetical protein ABIP36_09340 [Acidimicrobiales bacterium]
MSDTIVLHDLGDPDGGEAWRAAIAATAGCDGWLAPDLPGHGTTPAPRNGAYDPMAVVTLARRSVGEGSLVVGVGQNAQAALVLAAGGGCSRVALVDGLHGPFDDGAAAVARMYAELRAIAGDPDAVGPSPAAGLDRRATYGYGVHVSAAFLQRFWGAVTVPVLAVETSASRTPSEARNERLAWLGGSTTSVVIDSISPVAVLAEVAVWAT